MNWLWGPGEKKNEKRESRFYDNEPDKDSYDLYFDNHYHPRNSINMNINEYSPTKRKRPPPPPPPVPSPEYLRRYDKHREILNEDYERYAQDNAWFLNDKQRLIDDKRKIQEHEKTMGINGYNDYNDYNRPNDMNNMNNMNNMNIMDNINNDNDNDNDNVVSDTTDEDELDTDDEYIQEHLYLETMDINEIKQKETFFDCIYPFPRTLSIDKGGEFFELKSWLYNTIDALNVWHIYNEKPKLDYVKCMRYLSFKIREITLYYFDHAEEFKYYGTKNKNIKHNETIEKLINWKNSSHEHIQILLNDYPARFAKRENIDFQDFITKNKKCIFCCEKTHFDEIKSIEKSLDGMQLTQDQYMIFKNEYMSKLLYLDRRKRKFKKLFCFSNSSLQIGSVLLPALITIKDNTGLEDIDYIKGILDTSAIVLSIVMGIITNLTVFFKVNQRYSLYTQYDNKLKQEMRRFITYSEKYNDDEVNEPYRLFPQFSQAIENYIEELSNQEYDYIVGNKEKDSSANLKKQDIDTGDNETALDNRLSASNPTKLQGRRTVHTKYKKKKRVKKEKEEEEEESNHSDEKEDKLRETIKLKRTDTDDDADDEDNNPETNSESSENNEAIEKKEEKLVPKKQ